MEEETAGLKFLPQFPNFSQTSENKIMVLFCLLFELSSALVTEWMLLIPGEVERLDYHSVCSPPTAVSLIASAIPFAILLFVEIVS
jgi:hypothetical protein